jgi:sugar O-acyltransferase (sialic acid O-acetyltransferase NeuD family)
MGVPILGTDDDLPAARALGAEAFFIGVGRVGASDLPRRLFEWACAQGLAPLDLLHPAATLSPSLVHGPGLIALAGVVVNAGAQLGTGVVLNTGAIVEHEVRVGDHAFIAPRATLLGGVEVGPGAFLGAGCVVRQGVRIGAGALVGAGSVVLKDVPPGGRVRGVPARAFGVEGP